MAHPLVLALFDDLAAATAAARALRGQGFAPEQLSVVARSHEEEGELARTLDATPGVELEDSPLAARLGELGGHVLAAIAVVMPGIGPIVTAGPLAAGLGEAAGHAAGGIATILGRAGVEDADARAWADRVQQGALLLGVHTPPERAAEVQATLAEQGARELLVATWPA